MKQQIGVNGRIIVCAFLFLCLQGTSLNAQKSKKKSNSQQTAMEMPMSASGLSKEKIEAALNDAYDKFKDLKEGKNADYINGIHPKCIKSIYDGKSAGRTGSQGSTG